MAEEIRIDEQIQIILDKLVTMESTLETVTSDMQGLRLDLEDQADRMRYISNRQVLGGFTGSRRVRPKHEAFLERRKKWESVSPLDQD